MTCHVFFEKNFLANPDQIAVNYCIQRVFLRLATGFYMLIFQPPVNFCPHENIQPSFVVVGYNNVLKQFQFNNQMQGIS
jgi:hypothetical protein